MISRCSEKTLWQYLENIEEKKEALEIIEREEANKCWKWANITLGQLERKHIRNLLACWLRLFLCPVFLQVEVKVTVCSNAVQLRLLLTSFLLLDWHLPSRLSCDPRQPDCVGGWQDGAWAHNRMNFPSTAVLFVSLESTECWCCSLGRYSSQVRRTKCNFWRWATTYKINDIDQ